MRNPKLFADIVEGDPMEVVYKTELTLRDLFALAVISGGIAVVPVDTAARLAYKLADALLDEREKV